MGQEKIILERLTLMPGSLMIKPRKLISFKKKAHFSSSFPYYLCFLRTIKSCDQASVVT